mmetsp:Transcript_54779/g.154203  ORF Transcript_54779/g.154203 Transcript_54779/m.154203 type:complete len:289 (+) Transcript_54779:528-1394(+)
MHRHVVRHSVLMVLLRHRNGAHCNRRRWPLLRNQAELHGCGRPTLSVLALRHGELMHHSGHHQRLSWRRHCGHACGQGCGYARGHSGGHANRHTQGYSCGLAHVSLLHRGVHHRLCLALWALDHLHEGQRLTDGRRRCARWRCSPFNAQWCWWDGTRSRRACHVRDGFLSHRCVQGVSLRALWDHSHGGRRTHNGQGLGLHPCPSNRRGRRGGGGGQQILLIRAGHRFGERVLQRERALRRRRRHGRGHPAVRGGRELDEGVSDQRPHWGCHRRYKAPKNRQWWRAVS